MSESKKIPAPETKADAKETKASKTQTVAVPGPSASNEKNQAADEGLSKAINVAKGQSAEVLQESAKGTVDNPIVETEGNSDEVTKAHASETQVHEELVSAEDLENDPVLNDIGVAVGDNMTTVARRAISHIKELQAEKANKAAADPKITKDEVLAFKDGEERTFPRAAWNNMGSDRNGWVAKAKTPSEARKGNR